MPTSKSEITLSFDETHHLINGKPLYKERYKRVLSFHDNIAVVKDGTFCFFIDKKGKNIFDSVYLEAYGFYEGYATVKDNSGFFHITKTGESAYTNRFAWLGNFQEGVCTAKDFNGRYFHIDKCGKPLYTEQFYYVGDYKYGIAVCMNDDGNFTHIDKNGCSIHNKNFEDLQPFHKNCAVAKDKTGYFHINKNGNQFYSKRYKRLEPFYNGAAFATTFEEERIILQEKDFEENKLTNPDFKKLDITKKNFQYFEMQILYAIFRLKVFDSIKKNIDLSLPLVSIKLIFRWLEVFGLIKNGTLTPRALYIEENFKDSILYWQDLPFKNSAYIIESLQKGNEVFSEKFDLPYFDFLNKNDYYNNLTLKIYKKNSFDYSILISHLSLSDEIVCDLGAGDGSLLKMIKKQYPNIKTIFTDKFFKNEDHTFIDIDFFKKIDIEADVFILSRILHDWDDNDTIKILKNVKESMKVGSKLIILDTIVPDELTSDKGITLSFHLQNFVGGYERTKSDFIKIFKSAGFMGNYNFIETGNIIDLIILS